MPEDGAAPIGAVIGHKIVPRYSSRGLGRERAYEFLQEAVEGFRLAEPRSGRLDGVRSRKPWKVLEVT